MVGAMMMGFRKLAGLVRIETPGGFTPRFGGPSAESLRLSGALQIVKRRIVIANG